MSDIEIFQKVKIFFPFRRVPILDSHFGAKMSPTLMNLKDRWKVHRTRHLKMVFSNLKSPFLRDIHSNLRKVRKSWLLIFFRSSSFFRTWGEHVVYKNCSECKKQFLYTTCSPQVWACNSMNNLVSYCGLVDAKIRASDKDLPVRPIRWI